MESEIIEIDGKKYKATPIVYLCNKYFQEKLNEFVEYCKKMLHIRLIMEPDYNLDDIDDLLDFYVEDFLSQEDYTKHGGVNNEKHDTVYDERDFGRETQAEKFGY